METITVIFDKKGQSEISVKGAKGAKCRDLTKALERSLGATTGTKLTAEHNATEVNRARH